MLRERMGWISELLTTRATLCTLTKGIKDPAIMMTTGRIKQCRKKCLRTYSSTTLSIRLCLDGWKCNTSTFLDKFVGKISSVSSVTLVCFIGLIYCRLQTICFQCLIVKCADSFKMILITVMVTTHSDLYTPERQ